jgi:integrase/recombinase XerD
MKKIDSTSLSRIIRRAEKIIGLRKRINPHMIRHTFATHLLKGGADIREVQLLLGHESIGSTEIYLNLSSSHLKKAYEKYHPLENELFFDVFGRERHIFENDFPVGIKMIVKKELTGI